MLPTAGTGDRPEWTLGWAQGSNSQFPLFLECTLIPPQCGYPVLFTLLYGALQPFAGEPAVSARRVWLRFGNSVHAFVNSNSFQCYGKQRHLPPSFLPTP